MNILLFSSMLYERQLKVLDYGKSVLIIMEEINKQALKVYYNHVSNHVSSKSAKFLLNT